MENQTGSGALPFGVYAHNRAAVTSKYSVMPPEGILPSRLPGFEKTSVRIQTSPEMGARFAQMLLELEPGGGTAGPRNDGLEHFFYLLDGSVSIAIGESTHELTPHDYCYVPAGTHYAMRNGNEPSRLLWIKRPYERIDVPVPDPVIGHRDEVEKNRPHTDGRYWQYLLPVDDIAFDMHMNILAFEPGNYFPYVETHVMEHGLYMLEGQGLYVLAGDIHEVQDGDFIWMASYCPQFYFCTGWGESSYLLYKDVNRDVKF
ncbi:(S)-ureidoglycine aminohydrolase [soil metagenome]